MLVAQGQCSSLAAGFSEAWGYLIGDHGDPVERRSWGNKSVLAVN